jgi:UDP-N-acetylglucosamine acyltransferase
MEIKRAYKMIYRANLPLEQAKQELAQMEANPPIRPSTSACCEFIEASARGIIR